MGRLFGTDGVRGIAITRFTSKDVVRHPLVARIVEAYEEAAKEQEMKAKKEESHV